MKVKILLVTAFAALVLLVAVPTGSAAGPPSFSTISCTVGSASWSFRLPTFVVPRFLAALDRIHEHFPGLNCSVS